MTRCEDYPCCGCGEMMPKNTSSSICAACTRRMARRIGADDYFDYGMNY